MDHDTPSPSRRDRHRAQVAAVAAKEMSDTRFDRFRTRGARRRLVMLLGLATAVVASGWLVGPVGAFLFLAGLPLWAVLFYLLRRSIRNVADLPDEHLDERQIAMRDRTYLHAYRGMASLAPAVLFGLAIAADWTTLTYEHLSAVMWLTIGTGISLPAAILAWTTSDA